MRNCFHRAKGGKSNYDRQNAERVKKAGGRKKQGRID